MRKILSSIIFLFACSIYSAEPVFAEVVSLPAIQDTFASSYGPDSCNGAGYELPLYHYAPQSYDYHIHIKFDLASIPANAIVNSAFLRLYMKSMEGVTEANIEVWRDNGDWRELNPGCLTWSNQPTVTGPVASVVCHSFTGYKDWNVTDLVKGWVKNTYPNYGLKLTGPTSPDFYDAVFVSKDDPTNVNKPQLKIDYTVPLNINYNVINQGALTNLFTSPTPTPTPIPTSTPTPTPTPTPTSLPTPYSTSISNRAPTNPPALDTTQNQSGITTTTSAQPKNQTGRTTDSLASFKNDGQKIKALLAIIFSCLLAIAALFLFGFKKKKEKSKIMETTSLPTIKPTNSKKIAIVSILVGLVISVFLLLLLKIFL